MTAGVWEFGGQGNRGETGGQRGKLTCYIFTFWFAFLGILDFHFDTTASHNMQAKSFWTPHLRARHLLLVPRLRRADTEHATTMTLWTGLWTGPWTGLCMAYSPSLSAVSSTFVLAYTHIPSHAWSTLTLPCIYPTSNCHVHTHTAHILYTILCWYTSLRNVRSLTSLFLTTSPAQTQLPVFVILVAIPCTTRLLPLVVLVAGCS